MGRRTTAAVAALAGVVLVVSGCGTETKGKPEPSTDTSAAGALWDPCTQVSDAVLKQIGVDPGSKKSGVAGVEEPGWKVCSWHDPEHPFNYDLGIWATIRTVDEIKKKQDNIDFTPVTVGGRAGFTFRSASYDDDEVCDLVFPTAQGGSVQVSSFNISTKSRQVPPCNRTLAAAEILAPILPG